MPFIPLEPLPSRNIYRPYTRQGYPTTMTAIIMKDLKKSEYAMNSYIMTIKMTAMHATT